MKYLKRFNESSDHAYRKIPDNWIKLNSIGYVLNQHTGDIYPMHKDGTYDVYELFDAQEEPFHSLSEEDQETVDKYFKSSEPLLKNSINFELIDTLKDLSMDYIDEGVFLTIYVYSTSKQPKRDFLVYYESFTSNDNFKEFSKFYKHDMDLLDPSNLKYRFRVTNGESKPSFNDNTYEYPYKRVYKVEKELLNIIKGIAKDSNWNIDIGVKEY